MRGLAGAAAGLVAVGMGGAQAADLPVKAKPVEYVKICSLYGAGFYYIPGTDNGLGGHGPAIGVYGDSNITYGSLAGSYLFESVYSTTARTGAGRVVAPTGQQLTAGNGASIQFEHGWNAEWQSSIVGGAEFVDYNSTANAILCSRYNGGAGSTGTLSNFNTTCNMDLRLAGVGSRTCWTPLRDLTIGVEVTWTNIHSANSGALLLQPAAQGFKPAAVYEINNQNIFSVPSRFAASSNLETT